MKWQNREEMLAEDNVHPEGRLSFGRYNVEGGKGTGYQKSNVQ